MIPPVRCTRWPKNVTVAQSGIRTFVDHSEPKSRDVLAEDIEEYNSTNTDSMSSIPFPVKVNIKHFVGSMKGLLYADITSKDDHQKIPPAVVNGHDTDSDETEVEEIVEEIGQNSNLPKHRMLLTHVPGKFLEGPSPSQKFKLGSNRNTTPAPGVVLGQNQRIKHRTGTSIENSEVASKPLSSRSGGRRPPLTHIGVKVNVPVTTDTARHAPNPLKRLKTLQGGRTHKKLIVARIRNVTLEMACTKERRRAAEGYEGNCRENVFDEVYHERLALYSRNELDVARSLVIMSALR